MSHQELSSAKYFTENSAPEPDATPAELPVESSESSRAGDLIKAVNMVVLFIVIAGFSGGAYWLYRNQDTVPRMDEKSPRKMGISFLSWFAGTDVKQPSNGMGGTAYDHEDVYEQLERQNEEMRELFEEQQRQIRQSIGSQREDDYDW